jgi:hypothetical protein
MIIAVISIIIMVAGYILFRYILKKALKKQDEKRLNNDFE